MNNNTISSIGVIGYGRFGSFFANDVLPVVFPDAKLCISSRSLADDRVQPFARVVKSDLIIPAVPIRFMPEVLGKMAAHCGPRSIVMDVCSVKVFPTKWMMEYLPKHTPIISSHPMFGASSYEKVKHDLSKLTIVMHAARIDRAIYQHVCDAFASHFHVVEMSPTEHDKYAAQFQFLSHLLGGVLHRLDIHRSSIDTESASCMFDLMEVLNSDSLELFEDMYHFNPYAQKQLQNFDTAYQFVTKNITS